MEIEQAEKMVNGMETGKAETIVEDLKTQIQKGNLPERARVPSERELSEDYKVSRMTARRALQLLEAEGFVSRHPVRGTFVKGIRERAQYGSKNSATSNPLPVEAEELRRSGSFARDMERSGRKADMEWLEPPALVAADTEIAEQLELSARTPVLKRYRLQFADRLPYRIIESYYPSDLFGELLTIDIGNKPLFDWLEERWQIRAMHVKEELIARLPTKEEKNYLQCSPNAPVVEIHRTVWGDNDRVLESAEIIAVATLYTFSYEYDIPKRDNEPSFSR